jgi:adapter protein MecA 1/2
MKIEKINDKQIRCTISKADLAERKIKLSELACGTGNSKELFRDMIRQASREFGFEVDDIPLMVEAIPVSQECIVLILTKVDNPEETEQHFAKLIGEEEMDLMDKLGEYPEEFDVDSIGDSYNDDDDDDDMEDESKSNLICSIYSFDDLNIIIKLSKIVAPVYIGDSALYKSSANHRYYISLCTDKKHSKELGITTGILSEYGTKEYSVYNSEFFLMEHYDTIIEIDAFKKLADL